MRMIFTTNEKLCVPDKMFRSLLRNKQVDMQGMYLGVAWGTIKEDLQCGQCPNNRCVNCPRCVNV